MLARLHERDDDSDAGPRSGGSATERMCIATRTVKPIGEAPFAGQTVQLGFRYWTDVAVANPGFFADDIAISGQPLDDADQVAVAFHVEIAEIVSFAADAVAGWRTFARVRPEVVISALHTESEGAALFLVSFFSREPNVEYRPDEIRISHRGRIQRPAGIVPLTTGWGRQLLQPQQTQSAIYAFEPPFDYQLPLTIRYGLLQNDEWNQSIVPKLEEERTRVISRAGGWTGPQR